MKLQNLMTSSQNRQVVSKPCNYGNNCTCDRICRAFVFTLMNLPETEIEVLKILGKCHAYMNGGS